MLKAVVLLTIGTIILFIYYRIRKAWDQLNHLKNILQLVENSRDILYYFEIKPNFKYKYLSPAIEHLLSPDLVKESMENPNTAFERVHPDDHHLLLKKVAGDLDYSKPIIQRWKNDEGKYIWFEEFATPIYENAEMVGIQGIIRNIDEKVKLQKQLEYKVSHDTLTDLFNREFFESLIEKYDKNDDVSIAIIICDLDELKFVNDHFGHKIGDELIIESAKLLKEVSKEGIIPARIGGDEFALLMVNTDLIEIEGLLIKLQQKIDHCNMTNNNVFKIKMSKGYAFSSTSLGKLEQLLIEADNNMYSDKNKKKLLI